MLRTRVGYAGGTESNPTYRSMRDHTEAISIDFDPTVITYQQLLGHFWNAHRCDYSNSSRQYMNAVFYQNEKQLKAAEDSRAKQAQKLGISIGDVKTEIIPVREFTYAEGYHQKYYLTRHTDIRDFLSKNYPTGKALADSTVAARLNAYLGSGMQKNWKAFLKELPSYGLPEALEAKLKKAALKQ